jgi:hypothetical protein
MTEKENLYKCLVSPDVPIRELPVGNEKKKQEGGQRGHGPGWSEAGMY